MGCTVCHIDGLVYIFEDTLLMPNFYFNVNCFAGEKSGFSDYSLYSIGNGIIYQHKPEKLDQQADDINVLIQRTNDYQASQYMLLCRIVAQPYCISVLHKQL